MSTQNSSRSQATVTLKRGSRLSTELAITQVTAANCRQLFQVSESDVLLKDELDGRPYISNEDRLFEELVPYQVLMVQGDMMVQSSDGTLSSTPHGPGSPLPDREGTGPAFRSVTRSSPSSGTSYNLKIVKAIMKKAASRRVTFDPIHQMYLEIRESTANVNYVTMAVMKKWWKGYLLVTTDGLSLKDTDGTCGKSGNVLQLLFIVLTIGSELITMGS